MTDKELYENAKEAYYNGKPIMTDLEFDELEERLGLTNKAYVGTKHSPNYTVEHPFVMGSLSKVQIKENEKGAIDWDKYFYEVNAYLGFTPKAIITPKFDGCSFEIVLSSDGHIDSVSTRGDGEWGRDIKSHIIRQVNTAVAQFPSYNYDKSVLRGEVLIDKELFERKYSDYVNPRSFVAGVLGHDYSKEIMDMCADLSIVIYDIRTITDGQVTDHDWTKFIKCIPVAYLPCLFMERTVDSPETLKEIYNEFNSYRINECPFALDGIVFKPCESDRLLNTTKHRPSDCVAVKFLPMLQETTVTDIVWNLGKTGEWNPVIVTDTVIMDGKEITRASAHNYGYLIDNKVSVGTKVVLSLAGDIIPFIYKITNTSDFDENKLRLPATPTKVEGCHLMAILDEKEIAYNSLVNSMITLNIPGLGGANAKVVADYVKSQCAGDEFFGIEEKEIPSNVFLLSPNDLETAIGGKTGVNVYKAYKEILKTLSLKTIITSCNFRFCGNKVAEQIEKYMLGLPYDFASMAKEGYGWCLDVNSDNYKFVMRLLKASGHSLDEYKEVASAAVEVAREQIPVILTGEPNDWKSKGDFIANNPQYRVTGSWKEVKIVFTNSLESNTGKMKKAKDKGIAIRLY